MTYVVPTCEPTELTIGSSWAWDISYSDHRSDEGWTLAYYLRGPEDLDITAALTFVSADGSGGFEIRVPRATTDDLDGKAGPYRLTGRVFKASDDADGRIVYSGHVLVHADPLTAVNAKSFNRRRLEELQAATVRTNGIREVAVNGRRTVYEPGEYERLVAYYGMLVAVEENPDGTVSSAIEFVHG